MGLTVGAPVPGEGGVVASSGLTASRRLWSLIRRRGRGLLGWGCLGNFPRLGTKDKLRTIQKREETSRLGKLIKTEAVARKC